MPGGSAERRTRTRPPRTSTPTSTWPGPVDVPAGQLGQGNRPAQRRAPAHPPAAEVQRVQRVGFGGHQHPVADHQRLTVDRAIQPGVPGRVQPGRVGQPGEVAAAGVVTVVGGPVAGDGGRDGRRSRARRQGERRLLGRLRLAAARGEQDEQAERGQPTLTPVVHAYLPYRGFLAAILPQRHRKGGSSRRAPQRPATGIEDPAKPTEAQPGIPARYSTPKASGSSPRPGAAPRHCADPAPRSFHVRFSWAMRPAAPGPGDRPWGGPSGRAGPAVGHRIAGGPPDSTGGGAGRVSRASGGLSNYMPRVPVVVTSTVQSAARAAVVLRARPRRDPPAYRRPHKPVTCDDAAIHEARSSPARPDGAPGGPLRRDAIVSAQICHVLDKPGRLPASRTYTFGGVNPADRPGIKGGSIASASLPARGALPISVTADRDQR